MPWATDPRFLGSYSNVHPGGQDASAVLQIPEGRMYLAGEGTSVDYSATVHGAYLSGIDRANTINDMISSESSKLVPNGVLLLLVYFLFSNLYSHFLQLAIVLYAYIQSWVVLLLYFVIYITVLIYI